MQPAPSRQLHHDAQTAVSWSSENYQANLKCLIVSGDRSGPDPTLIPSLKHKQCFLQTYVLLNVHKTEPFSSYDS